jgi:hypothetical protein
VTFWLAVPGLCRAAYCCWAKACKTCCN